MAYNIGMNVVEVDGLGTPAIVGASTSVAVFNIITQRGVANSPSPVSSFPQFVAKYGSYFPGGLGAYLVKGFFDNGGQTAYINRVVSPDPTTGALAATVTLTDTKAVNTLKVDAGNRGADDPGTWGTGIYIKTTPSVETQVRVKETAPASVTGAALAATVDMTALPSLAVTVDNESNPSPLTFRAADFPAGANVATTAQIRDAINRQTSKLIASLSADSKQIILTSAGAIARLRRDFTRIQVTAANATLGFVVMAAPNAGTAAAITVTGTTLADISPFSIGDAIKLSDGASTAFVKIQTIDSLTNNITWLPALSAPVLAAFDPLKLQLSRATFDLSVSFGGNDLAHQVEIFTNMSMEPDVANYAVAMLNDKVIGSQYITVWDQKSNSGPGANLPAAATTYTPLTLGRDGTPTSTDFIGDPVAHTGFYAFDAVNVQLVTCERTDAPILTAGLAYCAGRGDCMYVGAVPQGFVAAGQAIAYGQAFQGKKVYGALYGPWIVITDPAGTGNNPRKTINPVGHIMGVYARTETSRGIWKAPAGDDASLLGVLTVETPLSDTDHTALVKQGSVNGVRAVPRVGVIIDASRTLSTDTRWLYVNVRLLFNYVKSSLKQALTWVRQEPNRNTLWDAIKIQTVNPFLLGLWRQGAFGTGTPAQVFTVICDASNNPPDQVDQGNLKIEVYFYPSKPAETIIIIVGQQPSGATVAES